MWSTRRLGNIYAITPRLRSTLQFYIHSPFELSARNSSSKHHRNFGSILGCWTGDKKYACISVVLASEHHSCSSCFRDRETTFLVAYMTLGRRRAKAMRCQPSRLGQRKERRTFNHSCCVLELVIDPRYGTSNIVNSARYLYARNTSQGRGGQGAQGWEVIAYGIVRSDFAKTQHLPRHARGNENISRALRPERKTSRDIQCTVQRFHSSALWTRI